MPTLSARLATAPAIVPLAGAPPQPHRIRGRQLQGIRRRHFQRDPLCVKCRALGRVVAATQVDHERPLWDGGEDVEGNRQGLCDDCHDVKTSAEAALRGMMR